MLFSVYAASGRLSASGRRRGLRMASKGVVGSLEFIGQRFRLWNLFGLAVMVGVVRRRPIAGAHRREQRFFFLLHVPDDVQHVGEAG